MDQQEAIAFGIFFLYFASIIALFAVVFFSITLGSHASKMLEGRAFFFLRSAVGALLCTWYFMIQFMIWSYNNFAAGQPSATVGKWLVNTALFEQAWTIVCDGPGNWWWSSWICTWTIVFTAIVWSESRKRDIKFAIAYMLLGQLVAMSVATALFLVAMSLHPRIRERPTSMPFTSIIFLIGGFLNTYFLPLRVGTPQFLLQLVCLHVCLLAPFFSPKTIEGSDSNPEPLTRGLRMPYVYALLAMSMGVIHIPATANLFSSIEPGETVTSRLFKTLFSHSAQASVSLDVVWASLIVTAWFVMTGSNTVRLLKSAVVAAFAAIGIARFTGVNWGLILSVIPIGILCSTGLLVLYIQRLRQRNTQKRKVLMSAMGLPDEELVQGTGDKPPFITSKKTLAGFWHPYCHAGGGGERVLWVAIRHLQRTEKETMVLVYSGDYPAASKEEIIGKVQERFSIMLDPARLHFVPLPSRHLIADGYWKHFTLLGQSLGSVVLAWEGLCGQDGLWGDIFIDTMGYAFTFPAVRLLAGSDIALGSYIHYPTVSADMVKRVRERTYGVENAGASKSWIKTQVKLVYYYIFTSIYSVSLLYIQYIMTNSTWTQAHIQNLLLSGRSSTLASVLLKDDLSIQKMEQRGESRKEDRTQCNVVYPPCDTMELVKLGNLENRKRQVVSLAQFRPEKDHKKQLEAFAELFRLHPEYKKGRERVELTLMGGVRDAGDQQRLDGLKALAEKLEIQDNVEFVVSVPYPEIVKRLGQASLGLNTMMDEHFGINVVEFMAAGLIPVVHASAGPLLDIVVPFNGQRTGFHATTAETFAEAIHAALSLSEKEQLGMRKAARGLAVDKFSEEEFERGWDSGWERMKLAVAGGRRGGGKGRRR